MEKQDMEVIGVYKTNKLYKKVLASKGKCIVYKGKLRVIQNLPFKRKLAIEVEENDK